MLFSAIAAGCMAMDPSLLMHTHTDPSRMRGVWNVASVKMANAWMRGGETAFTAILWMRVLSRQGTQSTMFSSQWSVEPARPTRSGGAELPPVLDMTTASGTRGWTFADPHYACPDVLADDWRYGCYAVNVETPCDLTVTLAGAERQVAASNGVVQVFNMQGTAADYTLAVSPADPSATYRIGFAVNPLVRFYGLVAQVRISGMSEARGGMPLTDNITNEWTMCVAQARLEGTNAIERLAQFTWDAETFPPGETTNAASRASFAKDSCVSIYRLALGDAHESFDLYGFKVFDRWLTDDELRNVRDIDMFEMRRRGMARWATNVEGE